MVKQKLQDDLKKCVKSLGYEHSSDIVLSISKNPLFGDYNTNLALQLAKLKSAKSKQSPEEIANEIIDHLGDLDYLEKVEVAGGGFINFFIKPSALMETLDEICTGSYQVNQNSKKIMVEFTDPNPFKEFHIGHLFSNSIGESLCRLLQSKGNEVKRVNYFGDVGMHVAKSVWGMRKKLKDEKLTLVQLEKKSLSDRIQFLAQSYIIGSSAYDEEAKAKEEIKKINVLIYIAAKAYINSDQQTVDQKLLDEVGELFKKGKGWSLEYFETIYKKLGTKFDDYYPESSISEYGINLVREYLKKGVFEESEGAIIFPGEKFGLHTRVFINSLGLPTYEAKELGLAVKKYEDYKYDLSIIVTGNEIKEYFQVLIQALSKVKPELAKKTSHIPHGMVRMTQVKISSRKGNVLTFEWLFKEVSKRISDLMVDSKIEGEEKQRIIDIVSIGAIKFSMLKSSPHMDISFDLEKSVSFLGDSGPYLQYSYARAKSVLRNISYTYEKIKKTSLEDKLEPEERDILVKIEYFQEILDEASDNLRPNILAAYLLDFGKTFNLFYQKHRILKGEEKMEFRLALTCAVAAILKQGLYLLGIEAPERM